MKKGKIIKRKKTNRYSRIIIFLFILLLLGILAFLVFRPKFDIKAFKENVSLNYGSNLDKIDVKVCYGNYIKCNDLKYELIGDIDTKKLGKQKVKYKFKHGSEELVLNQTIEIVDKEKPVLKIESDKALVCPNGKIYDLNVSASDNYDGDLTEKIEKTFDKDKVIVKVKDSSGNESKMEVIASVGDTVAPTVSVNGGESKTFYVGSSYSDEGVTVSDNCDEPSEIEIITDNNVNYDRAGSYTISYTAKDKAGNVNIGYRTINIIVATDNSRDVYLTFDDGPSEYTEELLDILKKYNVKATFFVTGNGSDSTILREYNEGHTVALHTNTHDYSYVYSSVDNYFNDLYAIQNRVERITGYKSNMIRFPGGSSNAVSASYDGGIKIMSILTSEVQNRGFHYYDWNISSGDAGGISTSDQVYNNVVSHLEGGYSIVLQHDTKKFSIDAVERIIQYGQSNGFIFKPLTPSSPKAHHGVYN